MARFLVIEDNAANLELLRYLLTRAGHVVACAGDGVDGLAALQHEIPDLVLCDLHMPRMDGYAFLAELRRDPALRDLTVVAVTAYSMPGDKERAMSAGFDGYLPKPLDPQTIVATIERHLPRRSVSD
jgi:CheY-like chemotaxis protein